MGRVDGKVAFITGVARGQGRSHALRLAGEGADIVGIDVLEEVPGAPYGPATKEDLAETVRQVEALGRRILATQADVRDYGQVKAALDDGVRELGRLDIVCANAGITNAFMVSEELTEHNWTDMVDVNLNGVWRTCKAAIPHLKAGGRGGSIILTSSIAGLHSFLHASHYVAAKHGVVGLMRTLANELGPYSIRVNCVLPTAVETPMLMAERNFKLFRPDLEHPTRDDAATAMAAMQLLPIPWVQSIDISNAVLFLASDEARYITGVPLPVDGGALAK